MGSHLADPEQRGLFLAAAAALGYAEDAFIFGGRASVERRPGQADSLHRSVHIARGGRWKSYAEESRWVEQALADLDAGVFGAPLEIAGVYPAMRDGREYSYSLACWPLQGIAQWRAEVRVEGRIAGAPTGTISGTGFPPNADQLRRCVEESIEKRIGVE